MEFRIMRTHLSEELKARCPAWVAYDVVAPFEAQAQRNHTQALMRLSDRGGLAPDELVAVMEGRHWSKKRLSDEEAVERLLALVGK